jgi:hypothetical protein
LKIKKEKVSFSPSKLFEKKDRQIEKTNKKERQLYSKTKKKDF